MRPVTVQVGYAKNKQYGPQWARRHVVEKTEEGWATLCNNKPSTREYLGFMTAVTCPACLKKQEEE